LKSILDKNNAEPEVISGSASFEHDELMKFWGCLADGVILE
jgi:hypothetical protein